MKKILVLSALLIGAPMLAQAEVLYEGNYVAKFPGNQCGMLSINQYGNIKYAAGSDCSGDAPTGENLYVGNKVQMRGKMISIDDASFLVMEASDSRIVGTWTFGNYVADLTFSRQ